MKLRKLLIWKRFCNLNHKDHNMHYLDYVIEDLIKKIEELEYQTTLLRYKLANIENQRKQEYHHEQSVNLYGSTKAG